MSIDVSCCIITYNHRPYIRAAIDSALGQEHGRADEIIVIDDCSTDGTRDIVREYAERHPGRVVPLLNEQNQGPAGTFIRLMESARGRYTAYLEGDDAWTDASKLRRQMEQLDAHPEWALCFHDCLDESTTGRFRTHRHCGWDQPRVFSAEDLFRSNFVPSCTVMYRTGAWRPLPDWYEGVVLGDWVFHALAARRGQLGYLPQVMAVHRFHEKGAWSGLRFSRANDHIESAYGQFVQHLGADPAVVDPERANLAMVRAVHALTEGHVREARRRLAEAHELDPSTARRVGSWRKALRQQPSRWRHLARLLPE